MLPVRIFCVCVCMCVLHATRPQHGRRTCVVAVSLVLSLASCGIRQRFRVDKSKMRRREGGGERSGVREGVNQLQTDCYMRQLDGCFLTSISICDLFACLFSHLQTATATASASIDLLPLTSTD